MRGQELAEYLNNRAIPGVRVYPTRFQPTSSNFAGKVIEGIRFVITDREVFAPVRLGIELGSAIAKLFPGQMDWKANEKLTGDRSVLSQLEAGGDFAAIEQSYAPQLQQFRQRRAEFLLY